MPRRPYPRDHARRPNTVTPHPDALADVRRMSFRELAGFEAKQREAHRAVQRYRYVLYGGARGGAKSYFARWECLAYLLKYAPTHPGVRVALFCETYRILRDRQISKVLREFPAWLGTYNDQNHEWTLKPEYGGGVLCFRNLDDPANYLGVEFAMIAVDQLEQNTESVFMDLIGSLRWPDLEETRFLGTANPGGIGHLWVKQYWLDRQYPAELREFAADFAFVRALPTDNPHLPESYWTYLRAQPEKRRKAWIDGDWSVFEGQVFAEWNPELHVVRHYTPTRETRWSAGMDWGSKKPGCVSVVGMEPDGYGTVAWEFYFRDMDAYTAGYSFALSLSAAPQVGIPEFIMADAQMWGDGGTGAITVADQWIKGMTAILGPQAPMMLPAPKGPGSRATRLSLLRDYLRWEERPDHTIPPWGRPRIRFAARCVNHIRTIPALPYDKAKQEDVDTDAEDHAYDALTYLLASRPPLSEREGANDVPPDIHPGFEEGRRRPRHDDDDPAEARLQAHVRAFKESFQDADPSRRNPAGFHTGVALWAPAREVESIQEYE